MKKATRESNARIKAGAMTQPAFGNRIISHPRGIMNAPKINAAGACRLKLSWVDRAWGEELANGGEAPHERRKRIA
jgi:hypothetical protein